MVSDEQNIGYYEMMDTSLKDSKLRGNQDHVSPEGSTTKEITRRNVRLLPAEILRIQGYEATQAIHHPGPQVLLLFIHIQFKNKIII